ncbi:MAG: DUF2147 domain-containing protein [Gammaproteobacteria bacterium]|nr:DUF2147 domain-containing protein [Gammaproteobacteria bacterium]
MHHFIRQAITLILTITLFSSSAFAISISGTFRTETNDEGGYLYVEMIPCETDSSKVCGKIKTAFREVDNGVSNPDYEHLGKLIVWDMEDHGDGTYSGGKIWAPDEDKIYKSKMRKEGDKLIVKGCILFICRGQDWIPVN